MTEAIRFHSWKRLFFTLLQLSIHLMREYLIARAIEIFHVGNSTSASGARPLIKGYHILFLKSIRFFTFILIIDAGDG